MNISEQISFKQSQMKIVDLYSWLQGKILQYKIKIQRNSAWKEEDRVELIDTIINGYPIPPIFISSGVLDEEKMQNIYHVLDGRQRLETIEMFINGEFEYDNRNYKNLEKEIRVKILNYFIPLITIDDSNVTQLKEIFKRLNKTAIKLNKMEITSSQYFEYSFMIFSKLAVSTKHYKKEIEEYIEETKFLYQNGENQNIPEQHLKEEFDETTEEEFDETTEGEFNIKKLQMELDGYETILENNNDVYSLFNDNALFSKYQINRQVNLQHFLNIFVTIIENEKAISRSVVAEQPKWQKKIEEYSSNKKEMIIEKYSKFKTVCSKIKLIFNKLNDESIFKNKSSLYTLLIFFYYHEDLLEEDIQSLVEKLEHFSPFTKEFKEYKRLIQDRVNDKNIRKRRYEIVKEIFFPGKN